MTRFAMYSHHRKGDGNPEDGYQAQDAWARMDTHKSDQVNRIWRPRATREEAVAKCLQWTGWLVSPRCGSSTYGPVG
jgi:hypothetical protein